ncbi:hypothetical protein, partial [Klebsiella aerogenes]|uniref:hypothetical protein n=1 Tax=Klebsiella aerogenes TaxID=548 RepID=UPI001C378105
MVKQLISLIFAFVVAAGGSGWGQAVHANTLACASPTMACCVDKKHSCCETKAESGKEKSISCGCSGQPEPQALGYSLFKLAPELLKVVVTALISFFGLAFAAASCARKYIEIDCWRPPKIRIYVFY